MPHVAPESPQYLPGGTVAVGGAGEPHFSASSSPMVRMAVGARVRCLGRVWIVCAVYANFVRLEDGRGDHALVALDGSDGGLELAA